MSDIEQAEDIVIIDLIIEKNIALRLDGSLCGLEPKESLQFRIVGHELDIESMIDKLKDFYIEDKMAKLEKGKKAATKAGMKYNVKVMEKAGYSKKRAEGTAYGEVGMEKKARKDEAKGIKKSSKKKC